MADDVKRRGRGWKILGIVVGVILACVGGLLIWVAAVSGRRLEQMDAKTKAMAAEWKARPAERPVLRGTAQAGNAWDDYNPALTAIKGTKDISRLGMLVTRDPKGDPEFGRTMLQTHAQALESLRLGASRATCRYPYDWEAGANAQMPGLLTSQNMANLAVLQARALAEAGKPREAAGVLLDLLQFGRDVGNDGVIICEMIGAALLQLGLKEALDMMQANLLDAAALRDLDAGLAALDGSFPSHGRALSNEAIFSGTEMRKQAAAANLFVRLLYAVAFDRIVDDLEGAAKAEAQSWTEVQAYWNTSSERAKKDWNPLTKMIMPGLGGSNKVMRHRLVQVRTLRIAIHHKVAGELLELEDPFGAKLKGAGALKFWSVGPDGVDDGGDGTWDIRGKDIVLDLGK